MKLHNKSQFYEETFSLNYTNLFPPLFRYSIDAIIDIQKIEINSSLVIIYYTVSYSISNIKKLK